MVRMDECVEALYNKESMQNKKKTLSIIRVMKGAISVSKSRTGECIFRHNKLENKKLERTVKKFKSDADYVMSRFDTKKKIVVGRWRTMLEKQTACNSTRLFNELLDIKKPEGKPVGKEGSDDRSYFKTFLRLRLQRQEYGANGTGLLHLRNANTDHDNDVPHVADNNAGHDEVYVTEKHGMRRRESLAFHHDESIAHKQDHHADVLRALHANQSAGQSGKLPSLPNASLIRRSQTTMHKTDEDDKEERPELTRDLTDWGEWRLNDKDWLLDYIKRQKTRHEDLIMRNALTKIEAEMSGNNTIRRHQVLSRLHRAETFNGKRKSVSGKRFESPRCDSTLVVKHLPIKSTENDSQRSLGTRSVTEGNNMLNNTPRKLQKEMTKVRMNTLPEPLPIILENPGNKKNTAVLPLITVTKA